jgi:uncharacterized protein YdaU (DUF1376 family)
MAERPAPPVPADADLRDAFSTMPFDVQRLIAAGIAKEGSATVFRAQVLLLSFAWHQVPAGSLPKDDVTLRTMLGLTAKVWKACRSQALKDFYEAADGRLYHPIAVELVQAALAEIQKREKQRLAWKEEKRKTKKKKKENAGKENERNEGEVHTERPLTPTGVDTVSDRKGIASSPLSPPCFSPTPARAGASGLDVEREWIAFKAAITRIFDDRYRDTAVIDDWRAAGYETDIIFDVLMHHIRQEPNEDLEHWGDAVREAHQKIWEARSKTRL